MATLELPFGYQVEFVADDENPSVKITCQGEEVYPVLSKEFANRVGQLSPGIALVALELVGLDAESLLLRDMNTEVQLELLVDPPLLCLAQVGEDGQPTGPGLVETPSKIVAGEFCPNSGEIGRGTVVYKDGEKHFYEGELKELQPNGQGRLISNGATVTGTFKAGKPHGHCVLTQVDGLTGVEGNFVNGEATGPAFNVENVVLVYDGGLRQLRFDGQGQLRFKHVPVSYRGSFHNGNFDGNGTLTVEGLFVYTGSFHAGALTGNGELALSNGWTVRGTFVDGKPCGKASLKRGDQVESKEVTWKQGRVRISDKAENLWLEICPPYIFVGHFVQNVRSGPGKLTNLQNGEFYDGNFANDQFDGQGRLETRQFVYVGNFRAGCFEGEGTIRYVNGCSFTGVFEQDKRKRGTFEDSTSHRTYVGEYKDDVPHGKGRLLAHGQLVREGMWEMGRYVESSAALQEEPEQPNRGGPENTRVD